MATTRTSNLSERSNGSSTSSTPHGRRTPRSSPGPRDRKTAEKPITGHVKSLASSRTDTTTKIIKAPPSSTSIATPKKALRSPMPTTLKDRALRVPSSLPKSASFSRTILDKTSASKTLTKSSTISRSLPPNSKVKTPVKNKVEKVQEEIVDDHPNETVAPSGTNDEEKHEEPVDETPVAAEDHHNALQELSVSSEPAPELHDEELTSIDVLEMDKDEDHDDEQHKEEMITEEEEKKAGDEQVDIEMKTENIESVKKAEEMPGRRKEAAPDGNAVIEKTASRLASRKNRVLALVGAFETVISLQEPEGGQQGN